MAQDKSAEIIKFNGAAEPPQAPAPVPEATGAEDAPSLEDMGAGAFLRAARERASLTIDMASGATKVKADHLEAIEWMRLDRLPALPYVTGFVKTYARYLGLDAEAVAAKFKAEALAVMPAPASAPVREAPQGEGARLGSVFAMLAVLLFALWIGYQVIAGGGRQAEETRIEARTEPQPQNELPPAASTAQALPQDGPDASPTASETISETAGQEGLASEPDLISSPQAEEEQPQPEESVAEQIASSESVSEPAEAMPAVITPSSAEPRERPLPRRARPTPPRQPVIVEAELTRAVSPDYPNRCTRGANDTESVTIRFDVSAEGRAVNARVASSTNSCFETEALRTVARWRFSPRTVDGAAAAEAGKTATVNFLK